MKTRKQKPQRQFVKKTQRQFVKKPQRQFVKKTQRQFVKKTQRQRAQRQRIRPTKKRVKKTKMKGGNNAGKKVWGWFKKKISAVKRIGNPEPLPTPRPLPTEPLAPQPLPTEALAPQPIYVTHKPSYHLTIDNDKDKYKYKSNHETTTNIIKQLQNVKAIFFDFDLTISNKNSGGIPYSCIARTENHQNYCDCPEKICECIEEKQSVEIPPEFIKLFNTLKDKKIKIIINTRGYEDKIAKALKCINLDVKQVENNKNNLKHTTDNILVIGAIKEAYSKITSSINDPMGRIGLNIKENLNGWAHRKTLVMFDYIDANELNKDNIMFFDTSLINIRTARSNGFNGSYCHEVKPTDKAQAPATKLAEFILEKMVSAASPPHGPEYAVAQHASNTSESSDNLYANVPNISQPISQPNNQQEVIYNTNALPPPSCDNIKDETECKLSVNKCEYNNDRCSKIKEPLYAVVNKNHIKRPPQTVTHN